KRFHQLVMQSRGITPFPGFLQDAEMQKALSLTDSQREKFAEIRREAIEKMQKEFPNFYPPTATAEARQKRLEAQRKMNQETLKRFIETFTPEQKKIWADMNGEPSEAVRTNPVLRPIPGLMILTPTTRLYWQLMLMNNEKAMAELKLEKP